MQKLLVLFIPKKKEMIFNSILPQELEIILKMLRNTENKILKIKKIN